MPNKEKQKVFVISLGCSKNLVDSEHMLGYLREEGLVLAESLADADIAVINTCGFIRSAVEEAIDTIVEVGRVKKKGRLKKLVVAGCFVQRYGYKLLKEMPEVDAWLGTGEFYRIGEVIKEAEKSGSLPFYLDRPLYLPHHETPRVRTTPYYSAYLKIAEGCSHRCSFCIIPQLRGPYRSRDMKSLLQEARTMARQGVKEINLIAQDTTSYGRDLKNGDSLEDLLEEMVKIQGLAWIRLLYCHPDGITDRLLNLLASLEKLCPYLDLPIQHVNPELLAAMGRKVLGKTLVQLINRIRSGNRRISIRTTLMVGFPGETEAMFQELFAFVKTMRFDHLGVFCYSPEHGTAAERFQTTVSLSESERRRDLIMTLQAEISKEKNQAMVNQVFPVLLEGFSPETDLLLKGRMSFMAPDVDGMVLINKGEANAGDILPVKITEAHTYDLVGEIVG